MKNEISKIGRKKLLTVLAVFFLCFAAAAGTLAYLHFETEEVENTFVPAKPIIPDIPEDFDGETKENVKVSIPFDENHPEKTGSYFVRAAIVVSFEDGNGNTMPVVPAEDTDYTIEMNDSDWEKQTDGYWLYKESVPAGGMTENLIESAKTLDTENTENYHLVINVLAQTVQAKPAKAIKDCWGYTAPDAE